MNKRQKKKFLNKWAHKKWKYTKKKGHMFCFGYLKLVIPKVDHISIQRGNESPEYDKTRILNLCRLPNWIPYSAKIKFYTEMVNTMLPKTISEKRKTEVYRLSDEWL